jgi:hypothetical protein
MHTPKVLFVALPFMLFIVLPPFFTAFGQCDRHSSVRRLLGRIAGRVESDSSRDFKASFSACAVFLSIPVKLALVELREKVTICPSTAVKATEVSPAVTVPAMSIAVGRLKQSAAPAWGPKAV